MLVGAIAWFRLDHWMTVHGVTAGQLSNDLQASEPRNEWKSIDKLHWQAVSTAPQETTAQTDAREGTGDGCEPGMVRVHGNFRDEAKGQSTGQVERLQDTACTDWISKDFPARCRTFDKAKNAEALKDTPTTKLDFCIDRFEYPNVFGQNPMIVTTWHEAEATCKAENKRLCTENEWTFACEGEDAMPYPYGYTRDETACVMDKSWREFTEGALQPRDSDKARAELDKLWQGEPSGSRPACRSPFGVYDMTGNVDEWTRSVNPTGFRSILKGGYWGPVRARCRPSTRAHNEDFIAYQQSFRCCTEPPDFEPDVDASADVTFDGGLATLANTDNPDGGSDDEIAALESRGVGCGMAPSTGTPRFVALFGALAILISRRRRKTEC